MQRAFIVLTLLVLTGMGALRFTVVGEPFMMWWEMGRPPHGLFTTSDAAARQLHQASPDVRFDHTFYYGESAGRFESIEAAAVRGAQLPEFLQADFHDGLSHGITLDDETTNELISQIATHIPSQYQSHLHSGIIRAYTEQVAGEPDRVIPFAEAVISRVGLRHPYNGVRIGLQRAIGDDLSFAITTARRYPEHYWPALFEELGWRSVVPHPDLPAAAYDPNAPFGDQPSSRAITAYTAQVPKAARCHFVHGAMRGRILERQGLDPTGWQAIETELALLDPSCLKAGYRGIAWGIVVLSGRETSAAHAMLAQVSVPGARDAITRSYARVTRPTGAHGQASGPGTQYTAPWEQVVGL